MFVKLVPALVQFINLTNSPVDELESVLSEKILLSSERGRILFQLWNYENDSALTCAQSAIELLEKSIQPDLHEVSEKIISRVATLLKIGQ